MTDATVNPMVEYLQSLRTQAREANPTYVHENRKAFLDGLRSQWPSFPPEEELHARTPVDVLAEDLRERRVDADLIFLTGDAGDGKTALCARIADNEELEEVSEAGEWTLVKDASELEQQRLRSLIARSLGKPARKLLVAVNEGRLRRVFLEPFPERPELWKEVIEPGLDSTLDDDGAQNLDKAMLHHRVRILNFRMRFAVREIVPSLIGTWTTPGLWEAGEKCKGCSARERCVILANVRSLRSKTVLSRLADQLAYVHFAGQRLPFRRLQGLLALAVTGGLECGHMSRSAGADTPLKSLRHRYYCALLPPTYDGLQLAPTRAEPVCSALLPLDPCLDADATADDAALQRQDRVDGIEAAAVKHVHEALSPAAGDSDGGDEPAHKLAALSRALRRQAAIEGDSQKLCRWQRALSLIEGFARGGPQAELLAALVRALNRVHGIRGMGHALARHQSDAAGLRNPARLALRLDLGVEFDAALSRAPVLPAAVSHWLGGTASEVTLEAWPKNSPGLRARLQLDARLIEALLAVDDGFVHLAGLGPYRRDLARFFSQLAVLSASAGHSPSVSLQVGQQSLRVMPGPKLRFEVEG